MKLITCCCSWSYVVGRRNVYGPMGIGDYPDALANSQRMMTRADLADQYADCAACISGGHDHQAPPPNPGRHYGTSPEGKPKPRADPFGPYGIWQLFPAHWPTDREGRPEPPPD